VRNRVDMGPSQTTQLSTDTDRELSSANKAVEDAIAEAEHAANPGRGSHTAVDLPADPPTTGDDTPEAPPAQ